MQFEMEKFGYDEKPLMDYASLAEQAGDYREAAARFMVAAAQFPGSWMPIRRAAACLRKAGDFAQSDILLEGAQKRFPSEYPIFFDYAICAEQQMKWDLAADRFLLVVATFPDDYHCRYRGAASLRHAGRMKEAEAALITAIELFPDEARAYVELAYLLGMIPSAARSVSLSEMEARLAAFIARLSATPELLDAQANLARFNGDYRIFYDRVIEALRKFPGHERLRKSKFMADELMLGLGESITTGRAALDGRAALGDPNIVAHFESLGGHASVEGHSPWGCEFGFIQREFGSEPLGLLRWVSMKPHNLIAALNDSFSDLTNPEYLKLVKRGGHDWGYEHTKYGIRNDHTNLPLAQVTETDGIRLLRKNLTFLARKLMEDIQGATKIFIYRYVDEVDLESALKVADAMNGLGPNTLFYVGRADSSNPALTVRRIHSGLIVGYIDWFSSERVNYPRNIAGWIKLCTLAYEECLEHQKPRTKQE